MQGTVFGSDTQFIPLIFVGQQCSDISGKVLINLAVGGNGFICDYNSQEGRHRQIRQ